MSAAKAKKKQRAKKQEKAAAQGPVFRVISENRKARHDFDILDRLEAGIELTGTEIKSVRAGRVNLRDSYAQERHGEMWLFNVHISQWTGGGPWNHDPVRPRRLLLHKDQIRRFGASAQQGGLTIVPLRLYIKGHVAKVELALAKGRRKYDKRRAIIQRETEREMQRAMRQRV